MDLILLRWIQWAQKQYIEQGWEAHNALQEARWLADGIKKGMDENQASGEIFFKKLNQGLSDRLAGKPLSRILGYASFLGETIYVNPWTLDPRPETEGLVEHCIQWFQSRNRAPERIVDWGTGSGCILLGLLKAFPQAQGWGYDAEPRALEMARKNAEIWGVSERAHWDVLDWRTQILPQTFDLLVSNPPYIATQECQELDPSVKEWDPILALDGGFSGIEAYTLLIPQMIQAQNPGGLIAFEIGWNQAEALMEWINKILWIWNQNQLNCFESHFSLLKDNQGKNRYLLLSV